MSTFLFDAFVSYEKSDRPQVRALIHAFQRAGLRVYWDQMVRPGEIWTEQLERAITNSRYTLICVTPTAVTSSFVEGEIKWSQNKIIPIFLEETKLPLRWEGSIGRIQRADLSRSQFTQAEPVFARLCTIVSGQTVIEHLSGDETLETRARRLIEKSSISDRSLVIALSILGGAATDMISVFAADFERLYRISLPHAPRERAVALESLTTRLQRLHAEVFVEANQHFLVKTDCARFVEPALGHTILALAWSEYEMLRAPIVNWINEWAAESPWWIRLRLAMNLGILAQNERRFDGIWRDILRPMLFKNARRPGKAAKERFEVADAALSIAALDPSRVSTVQTILNDMINEQEVSRSLLGSKGGLGRKSVTAPASQPGNTAQTQPMSPGGTPPGSAKPADKNPPPTTQTAQINVSGDDSRDDLAAGGSESTRIYVVARLALGFTGSLYPDLAVKTLRRLSDRGKGRELETVLTQSFRETMSSSRGAADGSLWDPIEVLAGLLRWASEVPVDEQELPLRIFIFGLAELPLNSDGDDLLSLTWIMRRGTGTETLCSGFILGLALRDTRDEFEQRLRDWRDDQQQKPVDPDPVLALAGALISRTKGRDQDRIKFIFRRHYDDAAYEALARQFPALIQRTEP